MKFKSKIKKFLIKQIPQNIKDHILVEVEEKLFHDNIYSTPSYSQEGEDLVLKRLLEGQENGLYVDVGAHHPQRFSNTYLFYKMGWRGINIDAMPGSMEKFKEFRPRDINLEIAISNEKESLIYYVFNEPALNTFSKHEAERKNGKGNYQVIDEIMMDTVPLSEVLTKHLNIDEKIDFLNIDVEGLDFKVLQSLNWSIHQPKIILIEDLNTQIERLSKNEIFNYLKSQDYNLKAKTFNTLIFQKQE